jgi:hypothetical protein
MEYLAPFSYTDYAFYGKISLSQFAFTLPITITCTYGVNELLPPREQIIMAFYLIIQPLTLAVNS